MLGWCVLFTAPACADQPEPPLAELAEICGDAAPVRLFDLEPNEIAFIPQWFGDRLVTLVHEMDRDESIVGSRVVSVDRCGEDPRLVVDEGALAFPPVGANTPVLAGGDRLRWIDPAGRRPAQLIGQGYAIGEVDGVAYVVMLAEDRTSAFVARMEVDGDVITPVPVLQGLAPASVEWTGQGGAETALVITLEQQLVEVELASGSTRPLAGPVEAVRIGSDRRFVLYRAARDYTADSLLRPWYVLDRETGAQTYLSHYEDAVIDEAGASADDESGSTDVVLLPSLHAHVLAGRWIGFTPASDGRIVATRSLDAERGPEYEFWVFDAPEDQPRRLLFRGPVTQSRVHDGAVWVASERGDRPLLRLPLDGGALETIAVAVHAPAWLDGDRFATVRDSDLVVFGGNRRVALVDHHVDADLDGLHWWAGHELTRSLLYQVHDDAHDRRALYLVELAP
jgi:hypothetical protein